MRRQQYFIDAWYLIAFVDRFDAHHRQTRAIAQRIIGSDLVTHDAIFAEVLAFFSEEGPRLRSFAAQTVRQTLHDVTVVPASGFVFDRALDLYERRPDKEYSLVDCMSMVVMEQRGIRHVLTNDHHFTQAGFLVVNE